MINKSKEEIEQIFEDINSDLTALEKGQLNSQCRLMMDFELSPQDCINMKVIRAFIEEEDQPDLFKLAFSMGVRKTCKEIVNRIKENMLGGIENDTW